MICYLSSALIIHQKARLEKLLRDLTESNRTLECLRGEVGSMEKETVQRQRKRSITFPSVSVFYLLNYSSNYFKQKCPK